MRFSLKEWQKKCKDESDKMTQRSRNQTVAFDLAKLWFLKFSRHADYMSNTNTINLPSCLRKRTVYQIYCDEMKGRPTIARTTFMYRIWLANSSYLLKQIILQLTKRFFITQMLGYYSSVYFLISLLFASVLGSPITRYF